MSSTIQNKKLVVHKITVTGVIQGIGFRPFVYRLATKLGIHGFVANTPQGVIIEASGGKEHIDLFTCLLEKEKPSHALIYNIEIENLDKPDYNEFSIKESTYTGKKTAFILPDIATCNECLNEIFDKNNRRYLYPFTNCTNCGPRYSIVKAIPYDRKNTTMGSFHMCSACLEEYKDPGNRRFHAEPNACRECGPHLEFWDKEGNIIASYDHAMLQAMQAIIDGYVVAVKGLGGFHLVVNAKDDKAISKLREKKQRKDKPFALMLPSVKKIKHICDVSQLEEELLTSYASPIVLLKKKEQASRLIADSVAPKNPYLGIMLPYTPLHHVLMHELNIPVVATSGNIADETICIDENEALHRLSGIADFYLVHNRPIQRAVDDSIARIVSHSETLLRRARGYTPIPIHTETRLPSILSVGAHLKNTIAISNKNTIIVSQHIGDLDTVTSYNSFTNCIDDFKKLYEFEPDYIACDLHGEYLSTKFALSQGKELLQVQHHYAHIISCMVEHNITEPVLGVAWDGTGLGLDKTLWGGEFLLVNENTFSRTVHFRSFVLPGGEQAIKFPRRCAIGLLYELFGNEVFNMKDLDLLSKFEANELNIVKQMLNNNINCIKTTSVGRIFDAVSSILDICHHSTYEGQAAIELEYTVQETQNNEYYKTNIVSEAGGTIIDWSPMIKEILEELRVFIPKEIMATKFHNTFVETIIKVAKQTDRKTVVLSGGCFQNKYLTEKSIWRLKDEGFNVYSHKLIPPNDGGISIGQLVAAAKMIREK
ncbi:MAG: carbamoyltransferase HypF [Candidatus Melainabacteria bacterium]|nr:carbamoyltransferase HypF [Candidatus Melainabacteria bacterium]